MKKRMPHLNPRFFRPGTTLAQKLALLKLTFPRFCESKLDPVPRMPVIAEHISRKIRQKHGIRVDAPAIQVPDGGLKEVNFVFAFYS